MPASGSSGRIKQAGPWRGRADAVLVLRPDRVPLSGRVDDRAGELLESGPGCDMLRANVLKVSHHGSKHGVNLELVERMAPDLTLISSVPGKGKYGFPHTVAQD